MFVITKQQYDCVLNYLSSVNSENLFTFNSSFQLQHLVGVPKILVE